MKFDLPITSSTKIILTLAAMVVALSASIWPQSPRTSSRSGEATAARSQAVPPQPVPERWRGLIGEYGTDKAILYILETDGRLCASFARSKPLCLTEISKNDFLFASGGQHSGEQVTFIRDRRGHANEVRIGDTVYERRQIGPEEGAPQLRITPVKPVQELLKESLAATPPKEVGDFRKSDLV